MKIAPVADVKAKLSAYLRGSQEGTVIITRNGKPVGVLLSVEDEEELERLLLAYSPPDCGRSFRRPEIKFKPLEGSLIENSGRI